MVCHRVPSQMEISEQLLHFFSDRCRKTSLDHLSPSSYWWQALCKTLYITSPSATWWPRPWGLAVWSTRWEGGIYVSLNSGFNDAPFAYRTGQQGLACPVVPGVVGWEVIAVSWLWTCSTEKQRGCDAVLQSVRETGLASEWHRENLQKAFFESHAFEGLWSSCWLGPFLSGFFLVQLLGCMSRDNNIVPVR